ncbi:MAG TPA: hypothetical protein VFC65_02705 [Prolixibacteraceae bacterium]|nr:hypothetical protein [Prolixibacteraceae bacterium]
MATKVIIGQAVRGSDFYLRPKIIDDLVLHLEKGDHILLSAPRRIGKTSIMFYLLDNPKPNYLIKYLITQSVNNENEFYKRIYKKVIEILKGSTGLWIQTKKLIKSKRISTITIEGVTIDDIEVSYYNELLLLLKSLDLKSEKLIIMIDEFSETLENIIKDEGEDKAIHFLESNRDFRHIPELHKKVQFIYTGSIGLENIVSRLNKINSINDLYPYEVRPFTEAEANDLIDKLINGSDLVIDDIQKGNIINEIEWSIPYFIQIIVDEIDKIDWPVNDDNQRVVTPEMIKQSIKNSLENRTYFEHWLSRLRIAFKGNEYKFVLELLNTISGDHFIHKNDIVNLSVKHQIQEAYKDILNSLIHDGYINNLKDKSEYRFNSPLLKMWWFEKVVN